MQLLEQHAADDPRLTLITGDLGFGVIEGFAQSFPNRFINAGVAEQNMIGVAAGLAFSGRKVFVYSISNFPTFRCLEQIRNDVCYHNLDVTIVSIGAGFSYGSLGYSHFALEDISVMRSLPRMRTYNPGNTVELEMIFADVMHQTGPKYIRLDKKNGDFIHSTSSQDEKMFRCYGDGTRDVALVSSGTIVQEAVFAAQNLSSNGIFVDVYSLPFLQPLHIEDFFDSYSRIFVIEEHMKVGGLYSILSEFFAERDPRPTFSSIAPNMELIGLIGSQNFLRTAHGIDRNSITEEVLSKVV